jgi:hypothetical protein
MRLEKGGDFFGLFDFIDFPFDYGFQIQLDKSVIVLDLVFFEEVVPESFEACTKGYDLSILAWSYERSYQNESWFGRVF